MICPILMVCPNLSQVDCVKVACAWWDAGNNCCCIKSIPIELTKIEESVRDTGRG